MSDRTMVLEPVVKKVRVGVPVEAAFTLFTRDMEQWWPLDTHSIAEDTFEGRVKATGLVFEQSEGGRIYETMSDGKEEPWGHVLTWEPPHRVVFTWKPTLEESPHTEVEVRFTSVSDGTEVELEHRGWDRLGADGEQKRSGYDVGWPRVLQTYKELADRSFPAS